MEREIEGERAEGWDGRLKEETESKMRDAEGRESMMRDSKRD